MTNDFPDKTRQFALQLEQSDGLLIAAGAGMGVDSGLPDFRGDDGFWNAYPYLGERKIHFHRIANPRAFERHPRLAWGFYGHRMNLYRATQPHRGFDILQDLANNLLRGSFVFTSNVDGHFQKAGFAPERIIERHGSIHHLQCTENCGYPLWTLDEELLIDEKRCQLLSDLPTCPGCSSLARPNILLFDDYGWDQSRTAGQLERLESWLTSVARLLIIEIGAGMNIPSVRKFCETQGGFLVRINPRESDIPEGVLGVGIPRGGLEALEQVEKMSLPSLQLEEITPQKHNGERLEINLEYDASWGTDEPRQPLKLTLDHTPLYDLINEASAGQRVYELMQIHRPGDVWRYVLVHMHEVGQVVQERYEAYTNENPEYHDRDVLLPYAEFDGLFYVDIAAPHPVDACWSSARNSKAILSFSESCWMAAMAAQASLRNTQDLLICSELLMISRGTHPYDRHPTFPLGTRERGHFSAGDEIEPMGLLETIERVAGREEIQSVSVRGGCTFGILKALCREQLRRSRGAEKDPHDAWSINILSNNVIDVSVWGNRVTYYAEGIPKSDLLIEIGQQGGAPVCDLVAPAGRFDFKLIVAIEDQGDIEGYDKISAQYCFVYKKTTGLM